MASAPRTRGEIKRVPVPVRNSPHATAPVPISTATSSPPVASQIIVLSSSLPSTQTPLVVRGQSRPPRGPIPIVTTNSEQPLPPHLAQGHRGHYHHHPQPPFPHTIQTISMDPESQSHRPTLPSYLEEDIKAAVLASMQSHEPLQPMRKRKTVNWKKGLRWTILILSLSLLVSQIPVCLLFDVDISAIFTFSWAPLLVVWNGYRLLKLRQKFNNERISGWHVGLESAALLGCIAITSVVLVWSINDYGTRILDYWYYYESDSGRRNEVLAKAYEILSRGEAVGTVFSVCAGLHLVVFIITVYEKWTAPKHMHTALAAGDSQQQQQQPPQIIVQYTPTCPHCHSHEPRRSEDENSSLARIGDSQPQGVAPVTIAKHKEAMYTDETLNDYERYYGAAGVART